jgi:RNA polymerase primary sigma factor
MVPEIHLPFPTLETFGEAELAELDDRTVHILRMRAGMLDGQRYSLREVGDQLDVTRERVRQVQNQGLALIRELREVQRHLRRRVDGPQ